MFQGGVTPYQLDEVGGLPDDMDLDTIGGLPKDAGLDVFEVAGVIKWFDASKGFGFIVPDNGLGDILLHVTCLRAGGFQTAYEGARSVLALFTGIASTQRVSQPSQKPLPCSHRTSKFTT